MNFVQAVVLGAVEGITEFLPISSTAHLMISAELLKLGQSDFVKSFEIAIQFGGVAAVIFLYWKRVREAPSILWKILAGFVPTAILGFFLYSFVKTNLLGNFNAVFWSLIIGGVVLILIDWKDWKDWRDTQRSELNEQSVNPEVQPTYLQAAAIGVIQTIAVIPGVSRSAATIIGGRLLGLSKAAAVEFSFLLALPTIAAAAIYDISKNTAVLSENLGNMAVGFIVSFITAIFAIKWLVSFIKKHSFVWFGVYRIFVALLVLWLIL